MVDNLTGANMASGYFDCVCCGTVDIHSGDSAGADDEESRPVLLCDACRLCDCGAEGDDPCCKVLLVDDHWGIYVPKEFVERYDPKAWGISDEDAAVLRAGPDHEAYWDTWSGVEGYVEADFDGKRWVLTQDGDLWAQCVGPAAGDSIASKTGIRKAE